MELSKLVSSNFNSTNGKDKNDNLDNTNINFTKGKYAVFIWREGNKREEIFFYLLFARTKDKGIDNTMVIQSVYDRFKAFLSTAVQFVEKICKKLIELNHFLISFYK